MILSSGTWTPTLLDGDLDDAGQTYSIQYGSWTRIGDHVYITGNVKFLSLGSLNTVHAVSVGGLPFVASSIDNSDGSIIMGAITGAAFGEANDYWTGVVNPGFSYFRVWKWEIATGTVQPTVGDLSADGQLVFEGHYVIDGIDPIDLSVLSYASKTVDISGGTSRLEDLHVNVAQTRCYIADEAANIAVWDFGTAGDISTITEDTGNVLNFSAEEDKVRAIWVNAAEDVVIIVGANSNDVSKYELSSAGDLTTASFTTGQSFSATGVINSCAAVYVSPDERFVFMPTSNVDTIYRYELTTPGDFSTGVLSTGNYYFNGREDLNLKGLTFTDDGEYMFALGNSVNTVVHSYILDTPWDLNSVRYTGSSHELYVNTEIPNGRGMFISSTFDKIFAGSTTEALYQYE